MHQILIIGAGPAGSLAAIVLARAGWPVTLIEQHRFPRDKVCGECLSALGIDVLHRHHLLNPLQDLAPARFTRTTLFDIDGESTDLPLPREIWGLSRSALDAALLNAARQSGARILQPARCERIEPGHRPVAVVRDLANNRTETLRVTTILLADGKSALLPHRPPPTGDLGVKGHFTGVDGPRDAIELFALHGHYIGIAAIEHGRWNVAMSLPAAKLAAAGGNLSHLFDQLLDENPALRRRLSPARRLHEWLAAPSPRFPVTDHWPQNIIPLGNAAAALEPIGGEGIGLALRSAELAAHALLNAANNGHAFDPARLRRQFNHLWRLRRTASRAAALAFSSPVIGRLTVLGTHGPAAETAMRWMGKG